MAWGSDHRVVRFFFLHKTLNSVVREKASGELSRESLSPVDGFFMRLLGTASLASSLGHCS